MEMRKLRTCCVIPAYRAAGSVVAVVSDALEYADSVVVVDDACPERCGVALRAAYGGNADVHIISREKNGGVGAAMKTGIERAFEIGADVIIKLDADGQMDPSFIPTMVRLFEHDPTLVCIKGNRFFDARVLRLMPKVRLFGNAILSLMAKFASGYWNSLDPTNGYLAFKAELLKALPWETFADSYFFELSVLCELGIRRLPVLELEMPTIYTSAPSSLSIRKVFLDFPPRLMRATARRLIAQYFIFDINLGTLYTVFGAGLLLFGLIFGIYEWVEGLVTNTPRATGTIMLAALPTLMGFQLLLNALMYDVQFSRGTQHELGINTLQRTLARHGDRVSSRGERGS